MVRQIQLYVPDEKLNDVMEYLEQAEYVAGLHYFEGNKKSNKHLVIFKMAEKRVSRVINHLVRNLGIGSDYASSIDILQLASTIPRLKSKKSGKKAYSYDDRMTTEEIHDAIDGQSHLTFDYLANVFVAATIAAAGLVSDSPVTVVASMLVSPLMGPILCLTFGASIRDRTMIKRGIRNEAYGILICLVVGLLVGLAVSAFYGPGGFDGVRNERPLRSNEIDTRGEARSLIAGLFVAIPSGMGLALGMTAGGINALVGVAISAALLPPIVNTGLCLTLGIWYWGFDEHAESKTWLTKSVFSFSLFLLNIVCIFAFAMLVFKLKNVSKKSFGENSSLKWNENLDGINKNLEMQEGRCCWFACCCRRHERPGSVEQSFCHSLVDEKHNQNWTAKPNVDDDSVVVLQN